MQVCGPYGLALAAAGSSPFFAALGGEPEQHGSTARLTEGGELRQMIAFEENGAKYSAESQNQQVDFLNNRRSPSGP